MTHTTSSDKFERRDRAARGISITEEMISAGLEAAKQEGWTANVGRQPDLFRAVFDAMWNASKLREILNSGFVIVPLIPTEKMLYDSSDSLHDEDHEGTWQNMIEAAPELSL